MKAKFKQHIESNFDYHTSLAVLLFITNIVLKTMAVCNLFNTEQGLTSTSGNFLMFSQYVEDVTQNNVKNDSNYRVVPSKFVALDIDYANAEHIHNVLGIGKDTPISDTALNKGIVQYFQNYFENGCAYGRSKKIIDANNTKNLFWNSLWDAGFLTYSVDDDKKIINEVVYYDNINLHSYNEHKGMGYGEIYCYIPTDATRVNCQVVTTTTNRESVKNESNRLEGLDIPNGYSKNYYYNNDFMMSFNEDKIDDIYRGFVSKYSINTIVVLYDVYEKLNDEWVAQYTNIPMGIYFAGKFDQGKLSNVITKYVTTSYGTGTSYGLRICTRFSVAPNGGVVLSTTDITTDENYVNFCQLMTGMNENLSLMRDIVKSANDTTQQYKDMLSIIKNNRTNVPYVKNINGDDCWFVNGRFVSKVDEEIGSCLELTADDINNYMNGVEMDTNRCVEVTPEELAEKLGINIEDTPDSPGPGLNNNVTYDEVVNPLDNKDDEEYKLLESYLNMNINSESENK